LGNSPEDLNVASVQLAARLPFSENQTAVNGRNEVELVLAVGTPPHVVFEVVRKGVLGTSAQRRKGQSIEITLLRKEEVSGFGELIGECRHGWCSSKVSAPRAC
jgi:hypothetical protein